MTFFSTSAMIALALVIPLATASRTILSMTATSTFSFLANSLNFSQVLADKISSHFEMAPSSFSDGKNFLINSLMMSSILVKPLAMIVFMYFSTSSTFILSFSAASKILLQTFSGRI